jgi:hypothetical protein
MMISVFAPCPLGTCRLLDAVRSQVSATDIWGRSWMPQAIEDDDQVIIKTVPRRGYRFTVPVSRVATNAVPVPGRMGDRPSVAVLPFANLSGDPQQEYFSDGITQDITTELSRFSELLVIARNSSFQYKARRSISGRSGASWAHATLWREASGEAATASVSRRSSSMP